MGSKVDPGLVSRFKKEQILDLAARSLTSVVAHFVLFLFIAVMTPMKDDHLPVLAGFGGAIFILSGLRIALARRIPEIYDQAPEKWGAVFIAMNVGSGLLWGGLALVVALYYPMEWPCFLTLVICCGLAAGATSSLGPHRGLSSTFTLAVLLPIAVWGFYAGTALGVGIGMLLVFSIFMYIRMAADNYLWYWRSVGDSEKLKTQARTMEQVIQGVNANAQELNNTSRSLSDSSGKMTMNAGRMTDGLSQVAGIADRVKGNSHGVVAMMTQASANFSNIASASEQMSATITDISTSAEATRSITANAVTHTEAAMDRMTGLTESATAINRITEAIGDISEQINLLALNATIEAARAGEAGKGFAVVAAEIKELAVQTSGSAGEISDQVTAIQTATRKTAGVMEVVSSIVREADAKVESIVRAVEEQSAATTEVSRNIQEVSQGFSEADRMTGENDGGLVRIAREMAELGTQAKAVEAGAGTVDRNADHLRGLAKEMASLVVAGNASA